MSMELMAPLMFAGLVIFLLLGYPVAFSLAANGLLFALVGVHYGFFDISLMQALPERVLGIIANQTLLAIPFFAFMGLYWNAAAWPKTCWKPLGSYLAICAAAWPTR